MIGGDNLPELKPDCPIMDGLIAGQCFAEHDGVHCFPAIRRETGEKYIIKVITIPASGTVTTLISSPNTPVSSSSPMQFCTL